MCIIQVDDMPSSTLKQLIYNEAVLRPGACGSCAPSRPPPSPHHGAPHVEETHTLEEIFDYSESNPDYSERNPDHSERNPDYSERNPDSSLHTAPEEQDENIGRKNLKNSRVKLCGSDGSWLDNGNIIELYAGEDCAPIETLIDSGCDVGKTESSCKNRADDDDCEKDVAEISPEKLEEDRQLEIVNTYHATTTKDESCVNDSVDVMDCFLHLAPLTVNVESVKEHGLISMENDDAFEHTVDAEDMPDECHWNAEKETEKNAKNVNDFREKSKSNRADRLLKKKPGRHRSNGTALDEQYRLPTEHLRTDTDYSNERLKQKRLAKVFHNVAHNQELNERLKQNDDTEWYGWYPPESELAGATAWYDFEDEQTYEANYGLATLTERSITTMRRLENDHKNYQRVNTPTLNLSPTELRRRSSQSSSPERPSGQETGARPKKISSKQRAL